MGKSFSAYLDDGKKTRSIRQVYAIVIELSEDASASSRVCSDSFAIRRKLEQIIDRPIAKAQFLTSIWRDFRALLMLIEQEDKRQADQLFRSKISPEGCRSKGSDRTNNCKQSAS